MSEHDESLEIGIAAGLDIPTAMVISEEKPPRKPSGCLVVIVLVGLVALLA